MYDDAINYADKYYKLAEKQYEQKKTTENLHNISVGCERVGDAYYAVVDFEQTEKWYLKALEIDREIDEKLQSVESAFTLSASLLVIGDVHIRHSEYTKAEQVYEEAVRLRKRIRAAADTDERQKQYGEAILAKGTALLQEGETDETGRCFSEAKELFGALFGEGVPDGLRPFWEKYDCGEVTDEEIRAECLCRYPEYRLALE